MLSVSITNLGAKSNYLTAYFPQKSKKLLKKSQHRQECLCHSLRKLLMSRVARPFWAVVRGADLAFFSNVLRFLGAPPICVPFEPGWH